MAEIYRARTRTQPGVPGRWVAIKLMRHALGHEDLREQLFKREARIASMLHHENVVELYEFGSELDRHYLAMEYMRGRDLSHVIRGQTGSARELVPFEVALFIGLQAAAGLGYAHRLTDDQGGVLNIIHRDISPGNVIIDYSGVAKVLDFGVARMNETHGLRTQTGTLRGKFAYMSPEQTLGGTIDARSDVFSLGTLLYEVLTGSNPFRTKTPIHTLERVQGVRPSPPSRVNREIPKEVDALLARCLAKDPRRRFRDALELHDALGDFLVRRGGDYRAQLSSYMSERFAWEKEEEERELRSEEDEVALLEVVDFSLGANDPGLDAPRVTVSHAEEASQQEVDRRSLRAAEDEESAYGVFDGRTRESGLIPERHSDGPPAAPRPAGPAEGLEMRSLFDTGSVPAVPSPSMLRREPSLTGQEEKPTIAIPLERPDSGLQDDSHPTRAIRRPSGLDDVLESGSLARTPAPRTGSMLSDPMLKAMVAAAPALERVEAAATQPELARPLQEAASTDAFREPAWWRQRPVVAGAMGALVSGLVLTMVALGFAGRSGSERAPKPTTTIAPVTIELPVPPETPRPEEKKPPEEPERAAEPPPPVEPIEPDEPPAPAPAAAPEERAEVSPPPPSPPSPAPEAAKVAAKAKLAPEREEDDEPKEGRVRGHRPGKKAGKKAANPPASAQVGYLNVAAEPWAEIFIDGKKWPYQTPQWGIELPPGKHVVRLYNRETNVAKTETVYIKAGAKRTLTADLRR